MAQPFPQAVERVSAHLRESGAEARIQQFPEGTHTAQDAADAVGCELAQIVKSLVFVCDARTVVALVPGDRRGDAAKIAAAVETNVMSAVMNAPYRKTESLIAKVRSLKSGFPMIIATTGMIRSSTSELMSAANARPITRATASSRRLPRMRKSLNSLIMSLSFRPVGSRRAR